MADAEKVIKGLEHCVDTYSSCGMDCPYWAEDCGRKLKRDTLVLLKAQESRSTVSHWISVNDRMPANGQDVLVYIDDYGESRITGCNYDNGVWYDCVMNCEIVIPNITHWMPLPEPPKEDDDDEVD